MMFVLEILLELVVELAMSLVPREASGTETNVSAVP